MNGKHKGNGVVKSSRQKEKYKQHPYKIEKNAKKRHLKELHKLERKAKKLGRIGKAVEKIVSHLEKFRKKFAL